MENDKYYTSFTYIEGLRVQCSVPEAVKGKEWHSNKIYVVLVLHIRGFYVQEIPIKECTYTNLQQHSFKGK
jgi:hypothetical protein